MTLKLVNLKIIGFLIIMICRMESCISHYYVFRTNIGNQNRKAMTGIQKG